MARAKKKDMSKYLVTTLFIWVGVFTVVIILGLGYFMGYYDGVEEERQLIEFTCRKEMLRMLGTDTI